MATALGQGGTNSGFNSLGQVLNTVLNLPNKSNTTNTSNQWSDLPQSTSPNVYQQSYSNVPQPQITGDAFNNGVNSDSGIAAILAGLYNSGVFNQQNLNPYAPQGSVGSFTGIPYGQQQESMFARKDLNGFSHNPYGGYQGQSWNPYGNYYTAGNTSTTNGVAPPPRTTGPDALQQLSFMMNQGNTQI